MIWVPIAQELVRWHWNWPCSKGDFYSPVPCKRCLLWCPMHGTHKIHPCLFHKMHLRWGTVPLMLVKCVWLEVMLFWFSSSSSFNVHLPCCQVFDGLTEGSIRFQFSALAWFLWFNLPYNVKHLTQLTGGLVCWTSAGCLNMEPNMDAVYMVLTHKRLTWCQYSFFPSETSMSRN